MADKKKPNKSAEDPGFEAIKNIGRKYQSKGPLDAQERQRLEIASKDINGLEDVLEGMGGVRPPVIVNGIKVRKDLIKKLSPRVKLRRETHRDKAIRDTSANIEREFGEKGFSSQVRRMSESSGAQTRGIAMAGKSQRELEKERAGIFGSIGQLEEKAAGIVQNQLYDKEGSQNPEALDNIKSAYRQKRALAAKAGNIEAALQKKRQDGTDDRSMDRKLLDIGQDASKTIFKNKVKDELQSGEGLGALNMGQLKEKEAEQAKGLADALERLKNAAGESAETIDKLREEAGSAADEYKKTKEAISQGGSGDGELKRRLISMVPGLMNTAAAAAQESLINQPMQTLGNRLGYASLSNAQYGQRNQAINGDMTALLSTKQGVGSKMSEVGENFQENSDIVRGLNLGAGAITAGLGVAQAVKGTGQSFNPFATIVGGAQVSEISGGIKTAVEGTAQAVTAGTDLINESSRSSAKLGGEQSIFALNNEVQKVRGDFRQSFYDYSQGTRSAALQAGGSSGANIMNDFASDRGDSKGMLGQLQKARIAPNEFAALAGQAGLEQGSVFNKDSIFQARNLERSGVGTKEMNMDRMSTLANAGANNPQTAFTSVLETAFSKGLDSSKALNMMVQNTAEMVRTSVGTSMLGMDTTAAASQRLATLVNENNPNKEAALSRSADANKILEDQTRGIGTNFSDQLGITRIARESNVDTVTAMALKKLDDSTADTFSQRAKDYEKASPNERKALARDLSNVGLANYIGEDGEVNAKNLGAGLKTRRISALGGGNFLNMLNPKTEGFDELNSGELTQEKVNKDPNKYRKIMGELGRAATFSGITGEEALKYISGEGGAPTEEGKSKAKKSLAGEGGSKSLQDADTAATAGSTDMANKARLAAKELGGAADALGKISKQMESLVGRLNDKSSGEFQNAAANAATDFKNSATTFNTASKEFAASVNIFSRIPTNTGDAVKAAIQPLVDKVNSMAGEYGDKVKSGPRK